MKNLITTSTELFNKLRSRFKNIKLGEESGMVTTYPAQARFFDISFKLDERDLGQINIKIDNDALTVIYSDDIVEDENETIRQKWFEFLQELRLFSKANLLRFDTRDIERTNNSKRSSGAKLTTKEYQVLAQETGENSMSESKLFGTSRTSYQDIGEAKIIVKHNRPVNYDSAAGRSMNIESIYVESATGERFRFPYKSLNGARAMAQHVNHGGTAYDAIGGYIIGLSEELSKLRQFKNHVKRSGVMAEALGDIQTKVVERIDTVKHEIASLQRPAFYATFAESFAPSEFSEVPEDMVNEWVDALTIKTFNEELKTVFPYIYKLVDHVKPVLGYEDIVAEAECKECGCDSEEPVEEKDHLEDYEENLEGIMRPKPEKFNVKKFIETMIDEDGNVPLGETGVLLKTMKKVKEEMSKNLGHDIDESMDEETEKTMEEAIRHKIMEIVAERKGYSDEPVEECGMESSVEEESFDDEPENEELRRIRELSGI